MSMSFSPFYGISFQDSGSIELTGEIIDLGNNMDEDNPVWDELYIVDEFENESDITFGIFTDDVLTLDKIDQKYKDYIEKHSLIDVIQNIIDYAVSQNVEVPNIKKYLERIKQDFPKPITMQVYI